MAQERRRRRRRRSEFAFVLKLIITVALVILIFEGRLIYTMITFDSSEKHVAVETEEESETGQTQPETEAYAVSDNMYLAGLADAGAILSGTETEAETEPLTEHDTVSNPDSTAIVREQAEAVDDTYFSDAVFIGDSRMEGFRNTSGIKEGTFFTSVGMSLRSMTSKEIISDGEDMITVAAALSGDTYGKIYIMLGANDLGEYSWSEFKSGFISVMERFQEIQSDAIFYVCSCIYVEEDKVDTGDYINNDNVDSLNAVLLEVCEEEGYYYLDLNEVLSDGYGSLIEDASTDGVHLSSDYCKIMLEYLKTHYVNVTEHDSSDTETESETSD
ncbi:MAG: GDSL-type esterase/lipase family protein [Lachnospiraceae bacterium]|nr:GDSL-type esterase/lipase family protein [Lachnospiraceae bacterium]MCD7765895.1 GDSL-type esterase/lipase family protein [Lachnospiraceae bacterium]